MAHSQILLTQLVHIFCIFHVFQLCRSLRAAFGGSQLQLDIRADAVANIENGGKNGEDRAGVKNLDGVTKENKYTDQEYQETVYNLMKEVVKGAHFLVF